MWTGLIHAPGLPPRASLCGAPLKHRECIYYFMRHVFLVLLQYFRTLFCSKSNSQTKKKKKKAESRIKISCFDDLRLRVGTSHLLHHPFAAFLPELMFAPEKTLTHGIDTVTILS